MRRYFYANEKRSVNVKLENMFTAVELDYVYTSYTSKHKLFRIFINDLSA